MTKWRKIEDYQDYSVSSEGVVRRDTPWRRGNRKVPYYLSLSPDRNGYAVVNLTGPSSKQKKHYVHRLVAEAFLPPQPTEKHSVAHWDGDGMNARVENLRWVTQSENEMDKVRHGRANYTRKGSRTFTPLQVTDIRRMRAKGASLNAIAKEFDSHFGTIRTALENGSAL